MVRFQDSRHFEEVGNLAKSENFTLTNPARESGKIREFHSDKPSLSKMKAYSKASSRKLS